MDGSLRVRCACGWEMVGVEDEVVEATQEHGRRMHNMVATREQVLAMAVPDVPPRTRRPRAIGEHNSS
jgi:predicted small metal-binding protein